MSLQTDSEGNERSFLNKYVDVSGKRILEVGCGEGRLTWKYARTTRLAVALDIDHDALRVAQVDRPYDLESRVSFACASSDHLPFAKEKFDIAILAWSL